MSIWKITPTLDALNARGQLTLVEFWDILFTEIGADYLVAEMPITDRVRQPMGLLHGGASAALAESIGSLAGNLCVDLQTHACVGLSINSNHLRAVREGTVVAHCTPKHIGRRTQVWQIEIHHKETRKPVCSSTLTLAVIERGSV